jgi:hypothetical protein
MQLELIASTGERFSDFAPYVPSVNDVGTVAFQADTDGRWSGFHGLPVITGSGTVVFRADRKDGVQGVYAARTSALFVGPDPEADRILAIGDPLLGSRVT